MPACAACGQENPDIAKFCLACGAPLAAAPPRPPAEERKLITVLFTDIVGSTARAEKLDPEDVRAMLAPYYARLRRELERFGGTVEKFIGDAVVALFGAPVAHEDDPERAVRAALAIRDAIADLNESEEWLDLHIRTGINTGEALVVLGAKASEGEGMASGDVMNTAARLQSAAPVDGVVVGELTYRATAHAFEYRDAEPISAKGKEEPVPVWEVVAERVRDRAWAREEAPLVGREAERETLSALWRQVRDYGRPAVATLLGAPGIGKTRLLADFAERAAETGNVHWGRCLSYGEGITYWPVTEIVKDAAGILHTDDSAETSAKLGALLRRLSVDDPDELRTMAAALANLVGEPETPEGTYTAAQISQAELHWGIRRMLELLANERPLVLVFEDLHWAEPTLLELVRFVAQAAAPILVVGSARPELTERAPDFVAGDGNRRTLELDALTAEQSEALLAGLGAEALSEEVRKRLLEKAAGNPLFLEETVRMLEATPGDAASLAVPATLQALIASRLDQLRAEEKRIAQHASVIGSVFWSGAVTELDGGSNGNVPAGLAVLERRDFVRAQETSSIVGEREFAFKHILMRDVAYGQLPKGRRAELHVRFADWTTAIPGSEDELVEIVAYHLEQSCQLASEIARSPVPPPVERAVGALGRAAEKSQRREGWREAERYYERALRLVGDSLPETALELRYARARTRAGLGALSQAWEELGDVAENATSLARSDVRCIALVTMGNIDHRQGRPTDARRRLTEATELAAQVGDRSLQIRAALGLAAVKADYESECEEAADDLRHAISVAEEIDDRALRVEGHLRLAFLLFNMGDIAASEAELLRSLELAAEEGSYRDEARATFLLGLAKYYLGDPDEAERLNVQARDWLERTGEPYFQMQNFRALGLYALARDDPEAAERWLREAIPVGIEEGGRYMFEVYRFLTEALVRQGRIADAVTLADFAAGSVPEEDVVAQAYVLLGRAAIVAADGKREATQMYQQAIDWLEEQRLPIEAADARLVYANVLRRLGRAEEARTQLEAARETFESRGATGPVGVIERELAEIRSGAGVAGPAPSI